jgi:Malonate decarboxylase, alpha subunit, transporter
MTTAQTGTPRGWDSRRTAKAQRLQAGSAHSKGKVIEPGRPKELLHDMRSGDRVALEGDNQKQASLPAEQVCRARLAWSSMLLEIDESLNHPRRTGHVLNRAAQTFTVIVIADNVGQCLR